MIQIKPKIVNATFSSGVFLALNISQINNINVYNIIIYLVLMKMDLMVKNPTNEGVFDKIKIGIKENKNTLLTE